MAFQNRQSYGEIFQIPTGGIDGIAKMVYQEQKQREQQKLQQDKALDDEFAKNVAGVKSSDIPEITKAYSDFKNAHINLQKKGQKATPQDQMDVMIKKANAFQAIAGSKEDKERIKQRMMEVKADRKGLYNPDAHTVLSEMLNTPTSQRKLDEDDDRLKYKYAMPNIDKEIANAAGKGQEIELAVGVDDKDPLKDKVEVYRTINPPNVFYNNLFTGLASRSDNKGFVRSTMDKYTDEEKDALRTAYEARIANPKFKALYGETKPFPESAANTELGQATALKTMEAVVNLPIDKVKDKVVRNEDRYMARKREEGMADKKTMAAIQDKYIRGRMKLNQDYKIAYKDYTAGVDAETDEKVLNKFINNTYDASKRQITAYVGGQDYRGRLVDLPKDIKDKYIIDKGYTTETMPDEWLLTDDKKTLIPLFHGEKTPTGGYKLKANANSKPIDIQNFKVDLGKVLVSQKQRGPEVIDDQFEISEVPAPTPQGGKPAKRTTITITSRKQSIPGF